MKEAHDLGLICAADENWAEFKSCTHFESARSNLANLLDVEDAFRAYHTTLAELRPVFANSSEFGILETQLSLIEADDSEKRTVAFAALTDLISDASARSDTQLAGKLSKQWAKAWTTIPHTTTKTKYLLEALAALVDAGLAAETLEIAVPLIRHFEQRVPMTNDDISVVGTLLHLVGMGEARLANPVGACETLSKSVRYFEQIASEGDGRRFRLARALESWGVELFHIEGPQAARPVYQRALDVIRSIDLPSLPIVAQTCKAKILNRLGYIREFEGDIETAAGHYEEAVAEADKLLKADSGPHVRQTSADCHVNLGSALLETGQKEAAISHYMISYSLAVGLSQELRTPEAKSSEASILGRLGNAIGVLRGPAEALVYLQASLSMHDELQSDVSDVNDELNHAISLANLGSSLAAVGQSDKALSHFHRALFKSGALASTEHSIYIKQRIVTLQMEVIEEIHRIHCSDTLLQVSRRCEDLARDLSRAVGSAHIRALHSKALARVGSVLESLEGVEAAIGAYEEALELARSAYIERESRQNLSDYANALWKVGMAYLRLKRPRAAKAALAQLIELTREFAKGVNAQTHFGIMVAHQRLGNLAIRRGAIVSALRHTFGSMKSMQQIIEILSSHGWTIGRIWQATRLGKIPPLFQVHEIAIDIGELEFAAPGEVGMS